MTTWWDHAVGKSAALTRVFTADDHAAYVALTGDDCAPGDRALSDWAHDEVPEPLIAGLFSTLLGVHLPGHGTNYLKQSMEFISPATIGEEVRATVEIIAVRPDKRLVDLETTCVAGQRAICRGQALVLARGVSLTTPSGGA